MILVMLRMRMIRVRAIMIMLNVIKMMMRTKMTLICDDCDGPNDYDLFDSYDEDDYGDEN